MYKYLFNNYFGAITWTPKYSGPYGTLKVNNSSNNNNNKTERKKDRPYLRGTCNLNMEQGNQKELIN